MNSITAWHFVGDTLRDGRPIPADGVWLRHDGPIVWCESGLYASPTPWDALTYAPGPTLCKVECKKIHENRFEKIVCRERCIVKRIDITNLLREFACQQALSVAHLWEAPEIVRQYLETGDETMRYSALVAARTSLKYIARHAVDAVRAAVSATSPNPVWVCSWDAARFASAASSGPLHEAFRAAGEQFNDLVYHEFKELRK